MFNKNNNRSLATNDTGYTDRLVKKQIVWWKRIFDVQAPYRWNLRRLKPGFTLDIGCGIGRNLINLQGKGVGIDHNLNSVQIARQRGLISFTPEEFQNSEFNRPQQFDSILLAHVAEHMSQNEVIELLQEYIHLLKSKGKLIVITPQEVGYRSDPTHVELMNFSKLRNIARQLGFTILKEYSFPFPRILGHLFIYNEFVSVSYKL